VKFAIELKIEKHKIANSLGKPKASTCKETSVTANFIQLDRTLGLTSRYVTQPKID
jgi:hypothetical protein